MCICWCITYINYKIHGATVKIVTYTHTPCDLRQSESKQLPDKLCNWSRVASRVVFLYYIKVEMSLHIEHKVYA